MENKFTNLASKVLAGEASDEEKKLFKSMLLESDEQSLKYNQLKEYWNADLKLYPIRDKEDFEEKLVAQIDFEPEVQSSGFRRLYLRIASVAAILFFVATCSLAYLYVASPRQLYTYSAQSIPADYILADGTMVKLNKNSSITFQSSYGDTRRDVELKGEAFFKVTKDKTRPFSVETLGTKTEVLGTSFNVKSDPLKSQVITTLVTGLVSFTAEDCNTILHPGEEIVYDTKSHEHSLQQTDLQFNTSWVCGRINYAGVKFGKLVDKLERIYNLKINIVDQDIANRIVSASILVDEPIENVLAAFEEELGFKYRMDSKKIVISRKTK